MCLQLTEITVGADASVEALKLYDMKLLHSTARDIDLATFAKRGCATEA